ncbi:MAG: 50S ribosomal protein L25 [Candidatus Saccharibacteria bacterium]
MSDNNITLELVERKQLRKGLNKFRKEGQVPAVIHNPGKDSIIVSGDYLEIVKVYKKAGKHHPIEVKLGDQTYLTIIKDVDFETRKHTIRHIVFGAIKQDEKVETEVPVVIVGDAPAQKAGLLLIKQIDHVKIEALPRDLPDEVTVSAESLVEIGDKITVADIIVPNGVTILTSSEHPIASIEETPAQESAEAEEEATAEATEAGEASDETPATD